VETRKNRKIKSILGFLQEDVPGAPVDAQEMDEVEQPAGTAQPLPDDMDVPQEGGPIPLPPPQLDVEDELIRKRRRRRAASGSADAFERALMPTDVNSKY
jgi:hypothetical protein